MLYSFEKNFEDLPRVIPLFPLNKVLILPRSKLPLNLFENRYLHMFDYALENGRIIGLIQPTESNKNPNKTSFPKLFKIGCAGYISAFSETNDKRYEIILKGLCRFKIKTELKLFNGFRRADVDWMNFKNDFKRSFCSDKKVREELQKVMKTYLDKISANADWDSIYASTDEDLVNSISMGCPFDFNEKQALLEANSINERAKMLISILNMHINDSKLTSPRTRS